MGSGRERCFDETGAAGHAQVNKSDTDVKKLLMRRMALRMMFSIHFVGVRVACWVRGVVCLGMAGGDGPVVNFSMLFYYHPAVSIVCDFSTQR